MILGFIVLWIIYISYPRKKPPPPPEPSKNQKDALVIEILKGADTAEIAKREGIDEEKLKQWHEEFLNDLLHYAKHRSDIEKELAEKTTDIKWFENVCKEYIGEDWKEKTEYDMRNR
ncbi:MAG: hypothetical protein IJ666_04585 [Ruminococcus sp.]|nr:hypothetical protein [Ruminococcus sp.]